MQFSYNYSTYERKKVLNNTPICCYGLKFIAGTLMGTAFTDCITDLPTCHLLRMRVRSILIRRRTSRFLRYCSDQLGIKLEMR